MSTHDRSSEVELKTVARAALSGVLRRGATAGRARVGFSRQLSLTYRGGRADKVEESISRGLTVSVYVHGKYAACETNALQPELLEDFLDRAVAMAESVEPDPDRRLPEPELYGGRSSVDLGLYDPQLDEVSRDQRHDYAAQLEAALQAGTEGADILSTEGRYQDQESFFYQVHSDGFEGAHRETQLWSFVEVTLRDKDEKRPSGWAVRGGQHWHQLAAPEVVAREALAAALARLGGRPIPTGRRTLVVENRVVGRLLRFLLAGLHGRALHQRASFLEGKQGQLLAAPALDLWDDPLIPKAFGSRHFDSEGLAAKRWPLFERGTLREGYFDTYYARKLGRAPTTGGASNVVLTPGDMDLGDLIAGVDHGLLVRGFLGGNSNATTGDFSLGVHGTAIEQGRLTAPVSEVNIAGNHLELWRNLETVGRDTYLYGTVRSPSLLFRDVQLSGT